MQKYVAAIFIAVVCGSCGLPSKKTSNSDSASASVDDNAASDPVGMKLHHPERLSIGRCNRLDLRFVDKAGKELSGKFDETVSISSSSPADKFYINYFNPNDDCGTQVSSFVVGPSNIWGHITEIFFKPSTVGPVTLTVIDTGHLNLPPITVSYDVHLIDGLKVTGPESQLTSDCSEIKVTSVLADLETASPVLVNSTVALTSDSSTSRFYSDNACSVPITSATIAAGNSAASPIYFQDTRLGKRFIDAKIAQPTPFAPHSSDDITGGTAIRVGRGSGSAPAALEIRRFFHDDDIEIIANDGKTLLNMDCKQTYNSDSGTRKCQKDDFELSLSKGLDSASRLKGLLKVADQSFSVNCTGLIDPDTAGPLDTIYTCTVD